MINETTGRKEKILEFESMNKNIKRENKNEREIGHGLKQRDKERRESYRVWGCSSCRQSGNI